MTETTAVAKDGPASPKLIGLIAGLAAFLAMLIWFRPEDLDRPAQIVAAIAVLMAIWWATDAIPLTVTALIPLVAFPLSGVLDMTESAAPYGNPIIFLFLGGFLVALAVERSQLHRRIALIIFRLMGQSGSGLVAGFMLVSAVLSMWISNTSTAMMLFPIAVSLGLVVCETSPDLSPRARRDFKVALLLGLAYGASIGGVATLVGTPPNAFMAGFLQSEYNIEVGFSRWLLVGLPIAALLLPMGWLLLTRVLFKVDFVASKETRLELKRRYDDLGPVSVSEWRTAMLFGLLVTGWLLREQIAAWTGIENITDAGIAIAAALLAFIIPSGTDRQALVTWEDTKRLPWGVLILFGGGLSLAAALSSSGLTLWMGQQLAPLGAVNAILLIVALTALVIFLTELTSNIATTATLLPVVAALAIELGINPLLFVVPVTIAASCAFMLPVATPPNAIVFSTGDVRIGDMMRAGFWLNIVSIILISLLAITLVPAVF
jgi:sodium-dependent dicarboxylate transporter 2/3/5